MKQNIINYISFGYIYLVLISFIVFQDLLTFYILLQNTLFFLIISLIIFYFHIKYSQKSFTYASIITYSRTIINILLLSIIINIESFNIVNYRNNYTNVLAFIFFISLILDAIDGFLARFLNQVSDFGKKFDLEIDTFLLFLLTLSLYKNFNVDLYVFLIPLFRYVFFILQFRFEWLNSSLPESFRRKFICSGVSILLICCHLSDLNKSLIMAAIISSILLITFSFLKDIIWLYMNNREFKNESTQ